MIPDIVYKAAAIVLVPMLIVMGIYIFALRAANSHLTTKNGELEARVATLVAEIKVQNDAVKVLEEKTLEYKAKLKQAYAKNEESQKELTKRLNEINNLKLPAECNGKIDVLKDEVIKAVKGWKV